MYLARHGLVCAIRWIVCLSDVRVLKLRRIKGIIGIISEAERLISAQSNGMVCSELVLNVIVCYCYVYVMWLTYIGDVSLLQIAWQLCGWCHVWLVESITDNSIQAHQCYQFVVYYGYWLHSTKVVIIPIIRAGCFVAKI